MGTTNLFVELVVIGVGAFVWVLLLLLAALGYNPESLQKLAGTESLLIPMLAFIYLLGILTDRLADTLFERLWTGKLRKAEFPNNDAYQRARIRVLDQSDHLAELLEYGRSRMRICRGWALNGFLIALSLNLLLWTRLNNSMWTPRLSWVATLGAGIISAGAWFSWRRLATTEYRKTREQAEYLSNQSVTKPQNKG